MKFKVRANTMKRREDSSLEGVSPSLQGMLKLLRAAKEDDWYHVTDTVAAGRPWLQITCEARESYRMEYFDPDIGIIYATSPPLHSLTTAEAAVTTFYDYGIGSRQFQLVAEWVKGEFQPIE